MVLRTELNLPAVQRPFSHADRFLTVGSCFSDAVGTRLAQHKFPVLTNPFGIAYNPYSIHQLLRFSLGDQLPEESGYCQRGEEFLHLDFHSRLCALSKQELSEKLISVRNNVRQWLPSASCIVLTYGTAWVYRYLATNRWVANCHKLPASGFSKELLTQKKILEDFSAVYSVLKKENPNLRIVLTVSPVRHVKDTLPLNSVSKSILRIACHTLSETYPDVHYFPAYELMMDDLRDYRFYKPDLIHPNEQAEDYIWQKFANQWFSESTRELMQKWMVIRQALQHKPFHPQTSAHRAFLTSLLSQLRTIENQLDVTSEIKSIQEQLT